MFRLEDYKYKMKRFLLVLLAIVCVCSLLSVSASAAAEGGTVDAEKVLSSPLDIAVAFVENIASAVWRLADYYRLGVSHMGAFAAYMPIVLAAILLVFALFGYRLFRIETVLIGALTGYAVGFAAYDFLLAWQGHPAFLDSYASILRWVLVGILVIVGMFLGRLLRRLGVSLVLGLLAAAYFARYTSNLWVLIAVFAIVLLIGIVAIKPVVIFTTAIVGGVAIARLLIGANGFYPMDLNGLLGVSVVDLIRLVGIFFGLVCAWIQSRTSRGRRYY